MKRSQILTLVLALAFMSTNVMAQRRVSQPVADTAQIVRNYVDSINILKARLDSVTKANACQQGCHPNGAFYRLFVPPTFYHSAASKKLTLSSFVSNDADYAVDEALMGIYLKRPDLLVNSENRLRAAGTIRNDVEVPQTQDVELAEQVAPVPEDTPDAPVDEGVMITKPNFWTFKGDYYLQFLQNYITSNWHKGGESNYSMLASLTVEANYNNKQKVKWDNKLEMKLGFQTSKSDTVHKFKANNDLLRLTSKLGLQAHKKWYYTLQLLAYTQFTRGLKPNDKRTYSDFMSPFNLNVGLGMDYKMEWFNKKLTGTVNISPLAVNYRYVDRTIFMNGENVQWFPSRHGVEADHHSLTDLGSQFIIDFTWKMAENISWKSRMYGFTSYKRVEYEWENTFSFQFNKYISSKLFIHPRFDDNRQRDDHHGYWMFKEYLSIGFNYSF